MRTSKIHIFLGISILGILLSCEREERHPIPYVYVNFTVNLFTDASYFPLRTAGNSAIITSSSLGYVLSLGYGDNGVIVYNAGDGEFYAFDRTCPHDIPALIAVDFGESESFVECPQCESIYVLPSMGIPAVGSASKWPLREYHTFYNPNTGDLTVTN